MPQDSTNLSGASWAQSALPGSRLEAIRHATCWSRACDLRCLRCLRLPSSMKGRWWTPVQMLRSVLAADFMKESEKLQPATQAVMDMMSELMSWRRLSVPKDCAPPSVFVRVPLRFCVIKFVLVLVVFFLVPPLSPCRSGVVGLSCEVKPCFRMSWRLQTLGLVLE